MAFIRTKNIKGHIYYYLVRGERHSKRVKQIHIKYLGKSISRIPVNSGLSENKLNRVCLERVPNDKPGVYYLYNRKGSLVYIGKAGDNEGFGLRHRISAHYQADADRPGWEERLSANSKYFAYKTTSTDSAACVFEKLEVAKYEPKYNNYLIEEPIRR
ncbi:MAG: hypothetical protein WC556_05195 [Candidatus Methanoperedens sp.]